MKLTVTLALVILTLFCSPASTEVCSGLLEVIKNLFVGTLSSYEAALEPFNPDKDEKDWGIQTKMLVDTLPQKAKDSMLKFMDKIIKSPQCA
ncbi:Uteroglobin [Camelus dromedarius]|uniref:Uteroglobin n=3 Tax=Camelus TaxID=9836 RepID=A0A5N4DPE5_CAMDR|nr:uteroglobin [Camelus ferus]XP_010954719.1 uteroglobin [Camelus bactrianus]XP_010981293.1 uteroglobin [Camelus dromedarius]KAB1273032.1 Uteroglobin [Camelus dromedarius]